MSLKVPIVKDQHPEYVYIKENSKGAVNNFKTNLAEQNIYDKLTPETNGDPKWIPSDIIKSINNRDNVYRKLKETSPHSLLYYQYKLNLRTLNIILKRSIFIAKKQYYRTCKNDMKNTWTILVDILKNKKKVDYQIILILMDICRMTVL